MEWDLEIFNKESNNGWLSIEGFSNSKHSTRIQPNNIFFFKLHQTIMHSRQREQNLSFFRGLVKMSAIWSSVFM